MVRKISTGARRLKRAEMMTSTMKIRRFSGDFWLSVFCHVLVGIITILMIYPLVYVFSMSISAPQYVNTGKVLLWPMGFTLQAYGLLFDSGVIWSRYMNSLIIIVLGVSTNFIVTVLAAYAFSRKDFILRKAGMVFVVITMFFSGGMIPAYLLVSMLGLMNTYWSVVLPSAASAWLIIIARTYFLTIPDGIVESGKIDGCSEFGILFRIMLPLSLPVIAVIVLFSAVNHWNSYFSAMLYITDQSKQPIQLYLARIVMSMQPDKIMRDVASQVINKNTYREQVKYAVIIVTILPIMSAYPILQKYFITGLSVGGIKS